MPCSNCGNRGHNTRTCSTNALVKSTKHESALLKLKKKFKKERKRSIARFHEIRELKSEVDDISDDNYNHLITITEQATEIEQKDYTIQKLKKGESEICNICFESVPPGTENKTKCGHSFHCGCLLKWLERKNTCPCCREELYVKQEINKDLDRVIGDAMVGLYSQSIVHDPDMFGLTEFANYIIEGIVPNEEFDEMPTQTTIVDYINDYYTEEEPDSSDDEEVWQELVGSEHDIHHYAVNSNTGEIRQVPAIAPGVGGVIGIDV